MIILLLVIIVTLKIINYYKYNVILEFISVQALHCTHLIFIIRYYLTIVFEMGD